MNERTIPKDVRCEIYSHIDSASDINMLLIEYFKTGSSELKLLFSCIRAVYGNSSSMRRHYELFRKL